MGNGSKQREDQDDEIPISKMNEMKSSEANNVEEKENFNIWLFHFFIALSDF